MISQQIDNLQCQGVFKSIWICFISFLRQVQLGKFVYILALYIHAYEYRVLHSHGLINVIALTIPFKFKLNSRNFQFSNALWRQSQRIDRQSQCIYRVSACRSSFDTLITGWTCFASEPFKAKSWAQLLNWSGKHLPTDGTIPISTHTYESVCVWSVRMSVCVCVRIYVSPFWQLDERHYAPKMPKSKNLQRRVEDNTKWCDECTLWPLARSANLPLT